MSKYKLNIAHDLQMLSNIRFTKHSALSRYLMNGLYKTTLALSKVKPPCMKETITIPRENRDDLICDHYFEDGSFFKPLILYFHGGGFQMEGTIIHKQMYEAYAKFVPASILAVKYRLLPEYPYPHAFHDAIDAFKYVLDNQQALGYTHIYVAGESAGGNLALALTLWARDHGYDDIKKLMLVYPVLTRHHTLASHMMYQDTPMWNQVLNDTMWNMYLGDTEDDTYASVLELEMHQLPNIHLETAQFDPLRDEGILLEKKVLAAKGNIRAYHTKYTVHGYDAVQSASITKEMMQKRIQFFKEL
jgi:acetyl esterase/lipase